MAELTRQQVEALGADVTTGPWRWGGHLAGQLYLETVDRGRQYVMGFIRKGMQDAQPTFQRGHFMEPAAELAVATIDHPDARDGRRRVQRVIDRWGGRDG